VQIRVKRQNINSSELTSALSGYIEHEGIESDVMTRLEKSIHHDEPIPEKYIRVIVRKMNAEFQGLMLLLSRNMDAWFASVSRLPRKTFLRKAEDSKPPVLTQVQIDELRTLIEAHFRSAIGLGWKVPKVTEKQWNKAGIEQPQEDLQTWIRQSYVAGRLADVLNNESTYADMVKLAKRLPLTRIDKLVVEAAEKNAAKYISGYGRKLADLAEDMLTEKHKSAIHDVVQRYFSGELTHTTYNAEGFTPQEAESLLSTDKAVKGWRELTTELKNRFKAVDVGRDWDRVAVSEVRFSTNLGRIMNIQVEGGGDPASIEVYYHVQPTACKHCKKLYLASDGTPKRFKLSEILDNIQETGGMNVGRKASLIGEEGGYIPNATVHPFCHCYPVRVIKGYTMPTRKER